MAKLLFASFVTNLDIELLKDIFADFFKGPKAGLNTKYILAELHDSPDTCVGSKRFPCRKIKYLV